MNLWIHGFGFFDVTNRLFNSPKNWTKKFDFTTMVPQAELKTHKSDSRFFFSEFQHQKLKKMMLSKSQLTSNVLNSFLPSFKNLTYLDLRSNSLTSFTNTIPQIKTIDIKWASFFANLRFCWISFSMWLLLMSVWLLSFYFEGSKLVRFSAKSEHIQGNYCTLHCKYK